MKLGVGFSLDTPSRAPVHASPIVIGDSVLYSTLEPDCGFYRANASTGDLIWRFEAPRRDTNDATAARCGLRACARVSADGRSIHASTDNNTFVMLDADSGEMVWSALEPPALCVDHARPVGQQNRPCEVYSTPLLVESGSGELRIQGSEDGKVRAFDAANGHLEWSVDLGDQANGSPALSPVNGKRNAAGKSRNVSV